MGLALFCAAAMLSAAPAADVACILTVSGPWKLARTAAPVHAGQGLHAGDSISLQRAAPRGSDKVIILGRNNKIVAQRHCATDECRSAVVIPADAGQQQSAFWRVVRAVMVRFLGEGEKKFSSVSTRDERHLYEGVVAAGRDQSDLTAIAGDLQPGKYKLVWEPISNARLKGAHFEHTIEVGDERRVMANLAELKPGLYDVEAFSADGTEPLDEAWVLAAGADSYPAAHEEFGEAAKAAGEWASAVSGDTVRRFLRAALLNIAAPKNGDK